jgi:hypothetical protein
MNLSVCFSIFLTIKISLENFGKHRNKNFDIGTGAGSRGAEIKLPPGAGAEITAPAPFCLSQTRRTF